EATQHISASYVGYTDHTGSNSNSFALTVTQRSTTTSVSCAPSSVAVNDTTSCTATVTDNNAGTAIRPSGTVNSWGTDVASGGGFSAASCSLSPVSTGVASCSVNFVPAAGKEGTQHISASYVGDTDHTGSNSNSFALTVTQRSTTTSVSCAPSSV